MIHYLMVCSDFIVLGSWGCLRLSVYFVCGLVCLDGIEAGSALAVAVV